MIKRSLLLATLFVSLPAFAAPLATVNGVAIDQGQLTQALAGNPALAQNPQAKAQVLNQIVAQEILAQAAHTSKLDQTAAVKDRITLATRQILANAAIEDYLSKHPVKDTELKADYQAFLKALGTREYKARHILVKSPGEADKIMAEIKKGANFASLAKAHSLDTTSAQHGGELGWFPPTMMVAPFADAISHAKKGAVVGPVKTQFGYHIIQVEDVRTLTPPPFAAVKDRLLAEAQQKKAQAFIEAEKNQAKVEIAKP